MRAAILLAALAFAAPACSGANDQVVLVGGERVDATTIDQDPLALLPSGPILLGALDAATMFRTSAGSDVSRVISNFLPIGPESNFVPSRDVVRMYGGMYAMQGADFAIVLQGNFDVDAIRRAADARAMTPGGTPLVKTHYGDQDIYTTGNIGFVALTSHTVISGNETGMRRTLDRLRTTKLSRSLPSWMIDLLSTKGAAFALAGDFTRQSLDPVASSYPFVGGLRIVRIVGNFQPPGINYAGTLTYTDPQSAAGAAQSLQNLHSVAQFMNLVSSWGFGQSLPPMQTQVAGNDVAFTMPLNDSMIRLLLNVAANATRPSR